ncbi:MAG: MFS transporter [Verrucomicrobiota bacterium]
MENALADCGLVRRNVPLFIAFRVLFQARFYYPVLSILFIDLGMTLEQYSLLNVAWAVTIVLAEVPSGAMADWLGRKTMVTIAAALMVAEMALIAFAPANAGWWLFAVLLVNRVLGGLAEASASGADEALAYDSLVCEGREKEWPRVLELLGRWSSVAFFFVMLLGGALYDHAFLNQTAAWLGVAATFEPLQTLRFPLYLTLAMGVLCFAATFFFVEPHQHACKPEDESPGRILANIRAAAAWLWRSPAALFVLAATLCFDSIVRLLLTFVSNYYRLIQLPEWSYGLLGASFAVIGFFGATLGRRLVERHGMATNYTIVAVCILVGLVGIAVPWPYWGAVWVIVISLPMFLTGFFVSHYLNTLAESRHRATVLSFRGLAINLAYGSIGLFYAALTAGLNLQMTQADGTLPDPEAVFGASLPWLPAYFALTLVFLGLAGVRLLRPTKKGATP